jgi:hypothetical protein
MTEAQIIHLKIARPSTRKTGILEVVSTLKNTLLRPSGGYDVGKKPNVLKFGLLLAALGIASGTVFRLKPPAVNGLPASQTISIRELHTAAHPENLPIQEVDDLSVIYPKSAQQLN